MNRIARVSLPVLVEFLEGRHLLAAPADWVSRGPGGGGAFFSPSINPANPSDMYVASDMSELFHTVSGGAAWRPVDFRQFRGNRGSAVQFTNTPGLEYGLDHSLDDGDGSAIPKKTTDGGATWTRLPGWVPDGDAWNLYADAANPNRVLVSTYTQLLVSNDGGATFTTKYTGLGSDGLLIAGAFFDGQNIYLGTTDGLLVSDNGGATFAVQSHGGIAAGQGIFSLVGAKQNGVTRLTCVTTAAEFLYPGSAPDFLPAVADSPRGVYTLDIGQANWTNRTAALPAGFQPRLVSAAGNNTAIAYVAGDLIDEAPIVLKTTNGGGTWASVFQTVNNANIATGWGGSGGDRGFSFGGGATGFAVSPSDSNRAVVVDYGFVHVTTDGGATWRQAYTSPADSNPAGSATPKNKAYHGVGLEDTAAWWLTWADANTPVAGFTDINGVRSTDAGESWVFPVNIQTAGNTIYQIAQQQTASVSSGQILYGAASTIHDIYQSTYLTDAKINPSNARGSVVYSTDKGASWSTLHTFAGSSVVYTALDPANANRMYASVVHPTSGGIYVTNNLSAGTASTWTKLPSPPRTQGHPDDINVLSNGALVVTYSGRRNPNFTASSGVFYSTDGGATWADRTLIGAMGSPGMQYWTKDLTIDPTDPNQNTWWASVRSGYGGGGSANDKGGLYKTTNRGVTWSRVFAADSVESSTITAGGELYVATLGSGLWYAPSAAAATPALTQTNYPFAQPERVFINPYNAGDVWVTSFGYGLVQGTNAFASLQGNTLSLSSATAGGGITLGSSGGTITATASGTGYSFPAASVASIILIGTTGPDALTINASLGKPIYLNGGAGGDTLNVTAGTTLAGDVGTSTIRPAVTVATGATLTANSSQHFGSLVVNGDVVLATNGSRVLNLTGLSVGPGGTLDLTNNAMQLQYGPGASPRSTIESLLRNARANGTWTGPGVTSIAARDDARHGTTLGLTDAAEYRSVYGPAALFANEPTAANALLLRYTLYGDTDLDGGVSINDFNRLSTAFGQSGRTWFGGDFDLDGGVSINDFNLLSANFGLVLP